MPLEIKPSVFREYDIRGIAGRDLTPEFANRLGLAYARYMATTIKPNSKPKVSIGWDCRLSSDAFSEALISGVRSGGVDVVKIGMCATPLTYFSVFHLELDGGIMITGSHNPADYNGFKICVGKTTIHGEEIQELRRRMEDPTLSPASTLGDETSYAIIPAYTDFVVNKFNISKKLKIVIDAGNATASNIAPELFRRLGCDVVELFCTLDGRFPNHHPDPTVVANLKDLIAKVKETGADFGVAFDGDSDRIGLVDEKGGVIFGDEIMVILSRAVLKNNPGATIISEVKSSHRLYNDIKKHGGVGIMWKTGHSLIKSKMKETGALLAGEMSGHIFFADRYFGYDDAIYAAARVLEIAATSPGPLSSLISDLPKSFSTPEIRVDCEESKKFKLVEETKNILKKSFSTNDIDGVRADFGDGWGLVRASNTQPVLVLRFEAQNQARLLEIAKTVENALDNASRLIDHPKLLIDLSGGSSH